MKRQLQKQDKKIIQKTVFQNIVLYIFTAIILYFLVFAVFKPFVQYVYNQANQDLTAQSMEVYNAVDIELGQSNSICYTLLQNENYAHILHHLHKDSISSFQVDILQISNLLRNIILMNDYISDIMVCFYGDTNIYITTDGRLNEDSGIDSFFKDERYADYVRSGVIDADTQFTGGKLFQTETDDIYFVQTYPVTKLASDTCRSTIYIKWRDNPFNNDVFKEEIMNGQNLVVNKETAGIPIISFIDNKTGLLMMEGEWVNSPLVDVSQKLFEMRFEENDMYKIVYMPSSKIPVTYVGILPVSALDEEIEIIEKRAMTVYFIFLIIMVVLILLNVWKIFHPIQQLIVQANGKKSKKSFLMQYYLSDLQNIIMESAEHKMANQDFHKERDKEAKKRLLCAALGNDKGDVDLICKLSKELGMYLDKEAFCFIGIRFIDLPIAFLQNEETGNEEWAVNFCEGFLIKMLEQAYHVNYFNIDNNLYFCISYSKGNNENTYYSVKNLLLESQIFFRERYAIDFQIGMSNCNEGVVGLRIAYNEIRKTMKSLELINYRNIMEFNTFSLNYTKKGIIPGENYMMNFIKVGDYRNAKESFINIMDEYYMNQNLQPGEYYYNLYSFMARILNGVNEAFTSQHLPIEKNPVNLSKIINFKNVGEFRRNIEYIFEKLDEMSLSNKEDSVSSFIDDVYEIVDNNYMNTELNVTAISELLGKNLDYVSRTFKKEAGEGLCDYIQKVRIEKAKQMFKERPDLTIQKVASQVGYVSCESFIRVFKNKEGVTPGKYKNSI